MSPLSHGLSGVAGEYYVCAELSRRGFVAALTLKNTEGVDILASRPGSGRAVSIQVKTQQSATRHWVLKQKNERLNAKDFFYIFVRLLALDQRPSFYIVPSKEVAAHITKGHQDWLAGQKRDGTARKDTPMRGFNDKAEKYLEKWELLK